MGWIIAAAVLLVLVAVLIYVISYMFVETLAHPKTHSHEESWANEDHNALMDKELYDKVPRKDFELESSRGYKLNGRMLLQPDWEEKRGPQNKVIILCHGWTSNMVDIAGYFKIFYSKGFNVVTYDHRYHGRSQGGFCSMGYYEHQDLLEVVDYARSVFGERCTLGLMGESMGAATVMLATPKIKNLAFSIEDCGYSRLDEEIIFVGTTKYHMPKWPFSKTIMALSRRRYGYDVNDVRPMDSVKASRDVPMLFVHGDHDLFVPSYMMMDNYNAKEGFKMCRYFKGSEHARSHFDHQEEYENFVWEFLEKINVI